MAHKTKVNGETKTITAGRCKVNGDTYTIKWGKTLIDGKLYMILFSTPTLRELMDDAVVSYIAGRNASSTSAVQLALPATGVYYVFTFNAGDLSINKVTSNSGTLSALTLLKRTSTSQGNLVKSGNNVKYSSNGTATNTTTRGATIAALTFPKVSESVADSLLSNATLTKRAGREGTGTATVYTAASNLSGKIALAAYGSYIGGSYWSSASSNVSLFGNTNNTSLLRISSGIAYLSSNGTSNLSVYGGSIVTMS